MHQRAHVVHGTGGQLRRRQVFNPDDGTRMLGNARQQGLQGIAVALEQHRAQVRFSEQLRGASGLDKSLHLGRQRGQRQRHRAAGRRRFQPARVAAGQCGRNLLHQAERGLRHGPDGAARQQPVTVGLAGRAGQGEPLAQHAAGAVGVAGGFGTGRVTTGLPAVER